MDINHMLSNIISICSVVFGIVICFFGFRLFRFVLSVSGFLTGSFFLTGVAYTLTEGNDITVMIIAGLAGGIICSLLLLYLYNVGIFLLGAIFGIIVSVIVLSILGIGKEILIYFISAVLSGTLTLTIQRFMLTLITSFAGAWITVLGGIYLINNNFNPFNDEYLNNISEIEAYRIILSLAALWVLGFITQYLLFSKKTRIGSPDKTLEDHRKS